MTRKDELENHIRKSYQIVNEYEDIIRNSPDRPEDVQRARNNISRQWLLISGFGKEYSELRKKLKFSMPEDIEQVLVSCEDYTSDKNTGPSPPELLRTNPTPATIIISSFVLVSFFISGVLGIVYLFKAQAEEAKFSLALCLAFGSAIALFNDIRQFIFSNILGRRN